MGATIASALGRQGWGLRKPYLFDFYFYVPDEAKAEWMADVLRLLGYQVDVRPGADNKNILCLATKLLVPEEQAMDELGDKFNALAARYGGEFDGWETGVN